MPGMAAISDEKLFPVWREPRSIWERTGLTVGQQTVLDASLVVLLVLFSAGWIYTATGAIARGDRPDVTRQLATGGASAPPAVFAIETLVASLVDWEEVRGASGEVRILLQEDGDTVRLPGGVPAEVALAYAEPGSEQPAAEGAPPARPGIWNLLVSIRGAVHRIPGLNVATLVPTTRITDGRLGEYRIGEWPREEGAYAPPRGLVQVTPENMDTHVSTHFQLGDFLTKGQEGVWPKYVVISPRLLDKLELTIQELERRGHPVENVFVISGFRTPIYNETGGGTQGRGALSRHMYGDAADIAIDNDHDACMDDLTGDGRATVDDARVIADAAEQVERDYPHLIGGIGIYAPVPGSHCGMVHIDTRGTRARW